MMVAATKDMMGPLNQLNEQFRDLSHRFGFEVAEIAVEPHAFPANNLILNPEVESVSLRSLLSPDGPNGPKDPATLQSDALKAGLIFAEYMPHFKAAFPIPGETESPETYLKYLQDPAMKWDILVFRDKENKQIIGGAQFQILRTAAESIPSCLWAEHIFLRNDEQGNYRCSANLFEVGNALKSVAQSSGAKAIIMEYNDSCKMTPEEIAEDGEAGLPTQLREVLWSRFLQKFAVSDSRGTLVLDEATGLPQTAPYSQPSMDGQPPIEFLSSGLIFVGEKPEVVSPSDLKEVYRAMWATFGCDDTDPTAAKIFSELDAIEKKGLMFAPTSILSRQQMKDVLAEFNHSEALDAPAEVLLKIRLRPGTMHN
ncbi:MAG: hypothetical protein J5J00_11190 [Deltaproteobacteria bacterium]|nr:hypothetical protein [Deltaproteobacteria bacterium]